MFHFTFSHILTSTRRRASRVHVSVLIYLNRFFRLFSLPEIQYNHISAAGVIPTVSVLFEFILFNHGNKSISTGRSDWLFVHVLGSIGFCVDSDDMSGGRG